MPAIKNFLNQLLGEAVDPISGRTQGEVLAVNGSGKVENQSKVTAGFLPCKVNATAAPDADDDASGTGGNGTFAVGSLWVDTTADAAYICVDSTATAAVWNPVGLGTTVEKTITFDGGGAEIADAKQVRFLIPYAATITGVYLLADQSGSIVIDIWKDTYANYPPTDADTITASAPPTISSATKATDTTLTGWTTSVAANSIFIANVDSCTTITHCTMILLLRKT
jgi:hypothetical protein